MKDELFTEMYRRYAALIMKSVVAQTKNNELAEEICQNVFIKYYENIDKVDVDHTRNWLLYATRNMVIDYWRKASTRKEVFVCNYEDDTIRNSFCPDIAGACADKLFVSEMLSDLYRKNQDWHAAVVCVCILQMTVAEAAACLDVDSGVLSARLYRAKKYLQKRYGDEKI